MTPKQTGDPFNTHGSDPKRLAGLVSLAGADALDWSPQELASMWKHQLEAPLQFDLGSVSNDVEATIIEATRVEPRPLARFVDLLRHPRPPVELLQWTKDFAKAHTVGGTDGMPSELAAALYYASILLARLRCNRRISELDDAALRKGGTWVMRQPWLDEETRQLISAGLSSLESPSGRE